MEKIKRDERGREKKVRMDLKAILLKAEAAEAQGGSRVRLQVRLGPGKNVKPERIVQFLFQFTEEDVLRLRVRRKALWIEKPDGTLAEP